MTAKIIPFPRQETLEDVLEKQSQLLEATIKNVKENRDILICFMGEEQHTLLLSQMLVAAIATRASLLKLALDKKQPGN